MIGVGLIGTGGVGSSHRRAWQLLSSAPGYEDVRIAAVSGRPGGGYSGAGPAPDPKRHDDWHALVDDPLVDIVDICAPDKQHSQMVEHALIAGKHVLCEKPLTLSASQVPQVLATLEESSLATGVALVYRHLPVAAFVKELVLEGRLGSVLEVRAHYLQQWGLDEPPAGWRFDADGGGVVGDLGTHVLDLVFYLLPGLSQSQIISASSPDLTQRATWTTLSSSGVHGNFHVSRTARGYDNQLRVEIFGTEGSAWFTSERPTEAVVSLPGCTGSGGLVKVDQMTNQPFLHRWWSLGEHLGFGDLFAHQVADMVDLVRGHSSITSATFSDGIAVDLLADAVRRAVGNWAQVGGTP